ncbi:AraC family transcriptional regulator [Spongiibacter sp. KMU-166]|uniref:AraC family transcriptional regulator n=1 Tax=Spongiibacter thalassae TaxID=2721624 RepID=A0ABX1GCU9_9GAMM|nr:AraC family transcriptional regulator [Spongiibacter thalassae]NKI16327.1 AraC family transcriptional regulator [Spongiibacter thalassae]
MSNFYIPQHIKRALIATLSDRGIDVETILNSSPTPLPLDSADYDLLVCHRLLQAGWYLLDDEDLGLGDGPPLKPGAFFYASNLMVNAHNLGEALKVAASFYNYVSRSWQAELCVDDRHAYFRVHRSGTARDPHHLLADYLLIGFYQFASWLIGERIALKRVAFDYPRPAHEIEFHGLFPCQRQFSHDCLEFAFHNKYLKQDIVRNAAALEHLLLASPSFLLTPQQSARSFQTEVRHLLEAWPHAELPSLGEVAGILKLTPKMLASRLRKEAISFNEIKKNVRLHKATQLLIHHNIAIAQIAESLGFEETAAFSKAFKNWTGESPAEYRKSRSSLGEQ